ncbi:periplasmic solute binding protein [Arthrobacter crystallopoietes BAB-32]|uniref:Periplasmic solute binding protein n=1 Tax=Arthrobacter crystallopoietes BAB-32 TaxID=1246476 RepID=N1V521_9MICC|nr:periplasmic solute binding protein [Arthrobacter crystallopoietes BAB-32]
MSMAALLAVTSCAASTGEAASAGSGPESPTVLASFYPLQYVAEKVGGDMVQVGSLTPPGAEPHDLELSPNAVAELEGADLVVYLSGFQPAVDEAVERTSAERVVDAAAAAGIGATNDGEGAASEDAHAGHDRAAEASAAAEEDAHAGHNHGTADPHFWLDPARLADVAHEVAHGLGAADPENADAYEANAVALTEELTALDEEFKNGLAQCERKTIVVSHEAYGFLADKYGLEQVGIAGLEPETEPSPARLAEIGEVVKAEGVTTVFSESLVNPKVSQTLADDLGIEAAVLDPAEAQADAGKDYQQVMRENLAALQKALGCK